MQNIEILKDTVVLKNYIGEIDDEAVYQDTIMTHCYCPINEGADLNMQGKKVSNSGTLFIFETRTVAKSVDGNKRTYLPYEQWKDAADKTQYWTLSDKGNDYFSKEGSSNKLQITGFSHKQTGTKRMWHYEVNCK